MFPGLRLTCNQSNSHLHEEVTTDLKYWVEKFENNKWVEVEYISPSVHWDETVVFTIPQNGIFFGHYIGFFMENYRVDNIE